MLPPRRRHHPRRPLRPVLFTLCLHLHETQGADRRARRPLSEAPGAQRVEPGTSRRLRCTREEGTRDVAAPTAARRASPGRAAVASAGEAAEPEAEQRGGRAAVGSRRLQCKPQSPRCVIRGLMRCALSLETRLSTCDKALVALRRAALVRCYRAEHESLSRPPVCVVAGWQRQSTCARATRGPYAGTALRHAACLQRCARWPGPSAAVPLRAGERRRKTFTHNHTDSYRVTAPRPRPPPRLVLQAAAAPARRLPRYRALVCCRRPAHQPPPPKRRRARPHLAPLPAGIAGPPCAPAP